MTVANGRNHSRMLLLVTAAPLVLLSLTLPALLLLLRLSFAGAATPGWNYQQLLAQGEFVQACLNSMSIAAAAAVGCILIALPMALAIMTRAPHARIRLLVLIAMPLSVSSLFVSHAWTGMLGTGPDLAITLIIAFINTYLPVMVLCICAGLMNFNWVEIDAARDLGAPPLRIFLDVILPAIRNSIVAGGIFIFIAATGDFLIPEVMSVGSFPMVGNIVWKEFLLDRNWPDISAMAAILLLVVLVPAIILTRCIFSAVLAPASASLAPVHRSPAP